MKTIKAPVVFNSDCGMFFDADGNHFADIRGWGFIQYLENPKKTQDDLGNFIADAINEKLDIDKINNMMFK